MLDSELDYKTHVLIKEEALEKFDEEILVDDNEVTFYKEYIIEHITEEGEQESIQPKKEVIEKFSESENEVDEDEDEEFTFDDLYEKVFEDIKNEHIEQTEEQILTKKNRLKRRRRGRPRLDGRFEDEDDPDLMLDEIEAYERQNQHTSDEDRKCLEENEIAEESDAANTVKINRKRRGPPFKNEQNGPYECEICQAVCKSRSLLNSHRFRKHRPPKKPRFACSKCHRKFLTQEALEKHTRRPTCESYPQFDCEHCGKKCIGLSNYNIHLRFHKRQYPFVCHLCGKKFMMCVHLNEHVLVKHENKRYPCEHPGCGKLFQTRNSLYNHSYQHSGYMPFECEYCKRGYASKSRLRFHCKKSHNIDHSIEELDRMQVTEKLPNPVVKPQYNVVNEIRHCNGKYSFVNAISGASKNNLVYHREANHYKEYTHNVLNKMPLEIVDMKNPIVTDVGNLEGTYNLEYDSFISEDYKQIKEESLSSEIGDIYEMIHGTGVTEENQKRRRENFKSALQKNAVDITLYNGNTAEEEQSIDCVGKNNLIGIDNHENQMLEQIHSENLQLYSAAETEESASNPAGIDETILHSYDTQNHLISFEARPQYECVECSKRFIKFRNYNNHLKTHNLASMHKCTKCDMIYLRATSLERHMEQFHTSPDQVDDQRCHFCQKFYTSKYALKIHMRFHTGDLPCECSTCGKRFSDNGHLRQHIRVKHQQFRFKCGHDNCGKIFETDRALRNHGYEHDKNWPFLCAHCGKGMGTKYNCRTHIFKKHKIYATDDELNAMQQFKRKKVSQSHCFQKVPNAKLKYTKDK